MRKLLKKSGLSLVETLITIVITVLLALGIDAGMNAASRVYTEAAFTTDSATLAGIVNTALGDLLRYAKDVRVPMQDDEFVDELGTFFVKYNEDTKTYTKVTDIGASYKDTAGDLTTQPLFVFSSKEYGIQDAYFFLNTDVKTKASHGMLQLRSLRNNISYNLINAGAYPDLEIRNFEIECPFDEASAVPRPKGYFTIHYEICSVSDPENQDKVREVDYCVRLMNF